MDPVTLDKVIAAVIGSILTFIFSSFFTLYRHKRAEKLSTRSYVTTEEVYAHYNLKNAEVEIGTKLIVTEEYEKVMQEINRLELTKDENFTGSFNYQKIKNLGPKLILNCKIHMKLESERTNEKWTVNGYVPLIESDEAVYISTDSLKSLNEPYNIKEIAIDYKTLSGEEMRYQSFYNDLDGEVVINERYLVRRWNNIGYKTIHKTESSNVKWIYLKAKK